jgi:hypothetical protein
MGTMGGCGDRITCRSVPLSSTICWTTWPGGTCTGIAMGGDEFVDTIGTVTGPAKKRYVTLVVNWLPPNDTKTLSTNRLQSRKACLLFHPQSSVCQSYKYKLLTLKYRKSLRTTCCFVWVRNLACHTNRTQSASERMLRQTFVRNKD